MAGILKTKLQKESGEGKDARMVTKRWIIPNGPPEGKVLDRWGDILGPKRRKDEEDFIYRKWLQTILLRQGQKIENLSKSRLSEEIMIKSPCLSCQIGHDRCRECKRIEKWANAKFLERLGGPSPIAEMLSKLFTNGGYQPIDLWRTDIPRPPSEE
ncbi:hypothetical protein KAR91_47005 [Candidatus Pacearchaeota archaeon]|nr:hypothetical protein [Candidatus Pacearchaeota archaeon]